MPTQPAAITVALVDDYDVVVIGVASILERYRGRVVIAELDKAITEARMPEEGEKQARKELKRLERTPEGAGEYSMIRSYLDWLTELPWAADAGSNIDIAEARRILDEHGGGLPGWGVAGDAASGPRDALCERDPRGVGGRAAPAAA